MSKKRIIYLDVIRILACCMIVLMHSPHPNAGNPGYLLVPLGFITAAGIGLFFMVSGALLLPVKTDTTSFLKKRFGKIMGPLIFWTLFYLGVDIITGERSVSSLPYALMSMPFSVQGHGVLWFLYTLAGLYLLAPIISPFLEKASRRELSFYLILWAITLCFPVLKVFLTINTGETGILYYFSGFIGYFLLGFYMHNYKPQIPIAILCLLFVVPFLLYAGYKLLVNGSNLTDYYIYLSIFVAMMCVAWYDIVQRFVTKFQIKWGNPLLLRTISDCCFGIYLIHIFIMRSVLWRIDALIYNWGGIGQIVITWLLTLSISYALTYFISYLPFAEYIIGYKHKIK